MHNKLPSVLRYKKHYFKHDLLAALALVAVTIPNALALATIAGLPPAAGLYTAIVGSIIFGFLGFSRRLVVGADSTSAILLASGATLVGAAGTPEYIGAIATITLVVGALLLILGICKFGFLADLVSRPVMLGLMAGIGLQLIITQLPAMLGLSVSGDIWAHLGAVARGLGAINGVTATVAILTFGVIIFLRNSRLPGELVGLLAAIFLGLIFDVKAHGVKFLSTLPSDLPPLAFPDFSVETISIILPTALSITLVILVQSLTTSRSLADEHGDPTADNRDLAVLGLANGFSAIFSGFTINGSPPRSQLADSVGMRTQLGNILAGIMIFALLIFGKDLTQFLPLAALSAIICSLGFRLIRFRELRYLWSVRHEEFLVAMVAMVCAVLLGVQIGILVAVAVSLMERLRRQYHPDDAVLLRDGKLSQWAADRLDGRVDELRHDTLVYAFGESLFFENVGYFAARLRRAIAKSKNAIDFVVIDAGAIDDIDYTAVETLKRLYREFSEDGIAIAFAHVSPSLREQFDIYGITDIVGTRNIYATLSAALVHEKQASALEMINDLKISTKDYVVVGGAILDMLHLRDTHNVDLVVSRDVYEKFSRKKHWNEVALNGKRILVREKYTLMKSWMGASLSALKKDVQKIDGVPAVSIERLIEAKRTIGRRKDLADIELLRGHLKRR